MALFTTYTWESSSTQSESQWGNTKNAYHIQGQNGSLMFILTFNVTINFRLSLSSWLCEQTFCHSLTTCKTKITIVISSKAQFVLHISILQIIQQQKTSTRHQVADVGHFFFHFPTCYVWEAQDAVRWR